MTIFSVSKSATLALKDLLMKKIPKKREAVRVPHLLPPAQEGHEHEIQV